MCYNSSNPLAHTDTRFGREPSPGIQGESELSITLGRIDALVAEEAEKGIDLAHQARIARNLIARAAQRLGGLPLSAAIHVIQSWKDLRCLWQTPKDEVRLVVRGEVNKAVSQNAPISKVYIAVDRFPLVSYRVRSVTPEKLAEALLSLTVDTSEK